MQLLPKAQLRVGGGGVKAPLGDVFVDEGRVLALELALDIKPGATGKLGELNIRGRSPDGAAHEQRVDLTVDVHAGPHALDRTAHREILLVRADVARTEARAHADRHALPQAAAVLRQMIAQIDASDGFVRNDGSDLAEFREQLEDEAANYERRGTHAELAHQRKSALPYTPTATGGSRTRAKPALAPGVLIGLSHAAQNRRFPLYIDTSLGRGSDNEVQITDASISRRHARILYVDDHFVIMDGGSTNGCAVNNEPLAGKRTLVHGDIVKIGFVEFRFEAL